MGIAVDDIAVRRKWLYDVQPWCCPALAPINHKRMLLLNHARPEVVVWTTVMLKPLQDIWPCRRLVKVLVFPL